MPSGRYQVRDGSSAVRAEQRALGQGRLAPGVAVLSKLTNVPIIPVRLVNANKVLPLGKKSPSLGHTVHVIFGEPIHPDEFATVPELLD